MISLVRPIKCIQKLSYVYKYYIGRCRTLHIGNRHTKKHKAHHPHGRVGAPAEMDENDPRILNFMKDTLSELDAVSEHPNRYKIVDIESATSQVVSGAKYKIRAKISLSNCLKTDPTSLEKCELLEDADVAVCDIVVWERRWLHKRKITVKCDNNDRVYTFEKTQHKNKRSLRDKRLGGPVNGFHKLKFRSKRGARQLNSITDSLDNRSELDSKILEYVKRGLQHLDSKSVDEAKYKLKRIVKVTKQVVSGRLWHITAEVALSSCPKSSYAESCQELDDKHKICNFEVWEQPWLTPTPKISSSCENNTSFFSPLNQPTFSRYGKKVLGMFQSFMSTYKKSYSDDTELNYRLKVFKDNLNTIKLLNKYEQGTGRYGVTEFADLTAKEFAKSHGLRPDLHNENYIPFKTAATPNITLPTEFDWRDKGAVTKVKNQGSCGSCWAFSTTGNIEGQYAIKYNKLLEFSEQELVDCDKLDDGCNGGLMDNAYRYIEETGGLEGESDYPYDAKDEKCHFNKSKVEVQITGALNISHNETDMAKWLVKNGPISIAINANAMQFYAGGVSHPWKILCNPKSLDHGVLIVGYGVHTYPLFNKTLPYWIVKNSWGVSWGEQGYYRVYRGDGTCGLNQTPSSAIVA